MNDIIFESLRSLLLLGLILFLWRARRGTEGLGRPGWHIILAGLGLLLFASILDIADSYPLLNRFVVIGETEIIYFLEKFVGYVGGSVLLIIGMVRWITGMQRLSDEVVDRRAQQRRLEDRESWYAMAATTARLGHWHFDEINDRYLNISDQYAGIFGCSADEFLNRYRDLEDDMELVHPDDRERVHNAYTLNADLMEIDYRILLPDGEIRHVREISRHIFDETGTLIETMGTLQDVTELKQAQFDSDSANQAKTEFLSRMSHELRTPLNAVIGFTQLLEIDPTLGVKQQKYVGHVIDAGNHLLTLIDEILDLERLERGNIQMNMEAVCVSNILQECEQLIRPLADKQQISLEIRPPSNNIVTIMADKTRLKQAALNFMSNAIKYNSEGGHVVVSCEDSGNGTLRINVIDTGPGISEQHREELFEPFTRLGAEHTKVEGTGIGLSITKRLVELMDGKIGVDTTVGEGSTFWMEFATN